MLQQTLKRHYSFEGKGLHTGQFAHMTICPAVCGTGIVFRRTDIGEEIPALAEYVSDTSRSTTLSRGEASVHTVEHIMSALTGLGIDNAVVELDNIEVPILDGSAYPYVSAIGTDGVVQQDREREYINLKETVEIRDEKSGGYVRIIPADSPSFDSTVDFGSKVLGIQKAHWDAGTDYVTEIGPCRTFVFFHEIEFLFHQGLVKGGDVDNAIVVVEHPVERAQLDTLCELFHKEKLDITDTGYLDNLTLRFDNECGRHKLLDLIGDIRLAGGYLNARIEAYKPGHGLNTRAAKALRESLKKK